MTALPRMSGLVGILLALVIACGPETPPETEIVARVGTRYLTRDQVQALLPREVTGPERKTLIRRIVENWVDTQSLALAARDEGVTLSAVDEWHLENLESEQMATRYMDRKLRLNFPVTDTEIEDYYNEHPEEFVRDADEVHLVHLYFEKLDNAIVKEIREASSLETVIQQNYHQASRVEEPNGDLGYVAVERLRPEFQRAIRGRKTGLIYGAIKTADGYHYLQVLDRQSAGTTRALELVRDDIIVQLQLEKRQQFLQELKTSARRDYDAETHYNHIF